MEYETVITQFVANENQEFSVLTFEINGMVFKCDIDEILQVSKKTSQDYVVNKIEAIEICLNSDQLLVETDFPRNLFIPILISTFAIFAKNVENVAMKPINPII